MTPYWDTNVAEWVEEQLPGMGPFNDHSAMGVHHKGEIVAGFVFHNYTPQWGLIEVSGAATHPRWATRAVLTSGLDYAFLTCKCQMVTAMHSVSNTAVRSVWEKLGADEVIIPRLFGRHTIGAVAYLTDDAWFNSKFRKGPPYGINLQEAQSPASASAPCGTTAPAHAG